jgi:chorismate mutase/prephenate dehydratase
MSLDELRIAIQETDAELLKLLEKRIGYVKQVGEYKAERNLPIYVPEVEKRKIEALSAECTYPGLVETIWPVIMCYARSVE